VNKKVVTPYSDQESKKRQVAKMFDNIAPKYDFLNHFLSLGIDISWRKKTIREIAPYHPKHILDVATGTADLAIEAARTLKPEKIIGVDIANEMLEIGRKKLGRRNLNAVIELETGDSENLRFTDETFDAVTVAFGVRNFENLEAGLREMHRVLRPGGVMAVLEFSTPTLFPFKQLYNFYFSTILPFIGRVTSKDTRAYSYLYESVQAFPDKGRFESILKKNGFKTVKSKALTLGICTLYVAEK
jgi:demethylmenaquinone methyltransferase/2-methoxy-6-polyprenyl-1,4-benzoquinol methylase